VKERYLFATSSSALSFESDIILQLTRQAVPKDVKLANSKPALLNDLLKFVTEGFWNRIFHIGG
jgi:hypothetical protein